MAHAEGHLEIMQWKSTMPQNTDTHLNLDTHQNSDMLQNSDTHQNLDTHPNSGMCAWDSHLRDKWQTKTSGIRQKV